MKNLICPALTIAIATFLSVAGPARAGSLTLDPNNPVFTPADAFSPNTISAEVIPNQSGTGDIARISGAATVTPPVGNTATIDVSGSYNAVAGDTVSASYDFVADLATTTSVQYTITGKIIDAVLGEIDFPPVSGQIDPGLHQYRDAISVPASFFFDSAGSFSGELQLTFTPGSSAPNKGPNVAAPGTLDLTIQQLDIELAPETATLPPPSVSLNISTRGNVQTDNDVLIGGFIIDGTVPKQVVIRAIGPTLNSLGVSTALANPTLELHTTDQSGNDVVLDTNDDWGTNSDANKTVITDNGLDMIGNPPIEISNLESILVETLDPGFYTAIVRGVDNGTGVGLVEVYDVGDTGVDSQLGNLSTRGLVQSGEDVLIGGFIIGPIENGASTVVVRALGPSLANSGVTDPLADPSLEIDDDQGNIIATNDNWNDDPNADQIATDGLNPTNEFEAATLLILPQGSYTAIVTGVGESPDNTGVGLVEVYNLQ